MGQKDGVFGSTGGEVMDQDGGVSGSGGRGAVTTTPPLMLLLFMASRRRKYLLMYLLQLLYTFVPSWARTNFQLGNILKKKDIYR